MIGSLLVGYLVWHYRGGLAMAFGNAAAGVRGVFNFFSVGELAHTLFTPWRRIIESYGRGFDPSRFFSTLAGNLLSRLLGAIVRSVVISVGIGASVAAGIAGVFGVILWCVLPILLPMLFVWGVSILW